MSTNNAAHTPGKVARGYSSFHKAFDIYTNKSAGAKVVALVPGTGASAEVVANADLVVEAFNVADETGLTPRQLAEHRTKLLGERVAMAEEIAALSEQRAQLLEALTDAVQEESAYMSSNSWLEKACAVIAKANGSAP